jgi:hypothetical protein
MLRWKAGAIGAVLCWTLLTGSASALSLADLVAPDGSPGTTSFLSGNSLLRFDGFQVVVAGDLSDDLSDYQIAILDDGFRIVGPFGAANGAVGDLALFYDAWAEQGHRIGGASLFFNGLAVRPGDLAVVAEHFRSGDELLEAWLATFVDGTGLLHVLEDAADFEPTLDHLHVMKDIQVISSPGGLASISIVEQRFTTPEPTALLLFGGGLIGLVGLSRRGALSAG